jgi:hypothetical protein
MIPLIATAVRSQSVKAAFGDAWEEETFNVIVWCIEEDQNTVQHFDPVCENHDPFLSQFAHSDQ